jgi:signal transduction histidine kinase
LLDRDPAQAVEPVEYCLSLADAGLAEMKALIFELRPESLEMEGIVAALKKQAESVQARYHLQVKARFCDEPVIPLPAKEALYRIAQEALQNIIKHAQAGRLEMQLIYRDGFLTLEIHDDGKGFDAHREFPGHLGLKSMRERAEKIGATFVVESRAGAGTLVRVRCPIGA